MSMNLKIQYQKLKWTVFQIYPRILVLILRIKGHVVNEEKRREEKRREEKRREEKRYLLASKKVL